MKRYDLHLISYTYYMQDGYRELVHLMSYTYYMQDGYRELMVHRATTAEEKKRNESPEA